MTDEAKTQTSNAVILVVVLLVFGVVLGGFGLYRYQLGQASVDWPRVEGTVSQSRPHASTRDGKQEYMPSVRYTYAVNGTSYTGDRITASDQYQKTRSGAEDVLRAYPVGAKVPVFYNPESPEESVLETGMPGNVYVLLLAAAACIVLAFAIAFSAVKKRLAARIAG